MDKVSRTFGFTDGEEEKELEPKKEEEPQAPNPEPEPQPTVTSGFVGRSTNVVDFNSAISTRENVPKGNAMPQGVVKTKITTIKPKDFNDAQTVANCLRDKIPVIMNFEDTDDEESRRIIDFISGTTYAIGGEIKKVSGKVFVCAPDNVTVSWSEDEKRSMGKFMD